MGWPMEIILRALRQMNTDTYNVMIALLMNIHMPPTFL